MIYVCKDKDFAEIRKMFNLILPKSVKYFNLILPKSVKCFGANMPKSVKCLTILEEKSHKSGGFYPPSLFLNPYCQRILVKVYAVMLDEQRERASVSQLVR